MATKQQAIAAIQQHGGEIDWDVSYISRGDKAIVVDAPAGCYWLASEAKTFSIIWYCGPASGFWDEVIEYASWGVEPD
jgi:hypothetical protein